MSLVLRNDFAVWRTEMSSERIINTPLKVIVKEIIPKTNREETTGGEWKYSNFQDDFDYDGSAG